MLYHVSIEADEPIRVARFFAEIWGGFAAPFPSVIEGSWVALADDDRGTMVEVYPRGTQLVAGEEGAFGKRGPARGANSTHFAMATKLDLPTVLAIAEREGWPAQHFMRGGVFGVIEIWVEGWQMVEVLTGEMQAQYLGAITVQNWKRMLESGQVAKAA